VPFYYRNYYSADTGGFDTFTNAFSLPNLEYLEILGGFTGASEEEHGIIVPEEWEVPLFSHLRTLRLEDVGFGRNGLAFLQCLSRNITSLQLIYTEGNSHLLQ
jgi:hypothetical protein